MENQNLLEIMMDKVFLQKPLLFTRHFSNLKFYDLKNWQLY